MNENILLACLGSSGLAAIIVAILNLVLPRVFKKTDEKDEAKKMFARLDTHMVRSELNDVQTHLLIMINHYPEDHKAIICEAEKYFLELHGDSWMYSIFTTWAEKEGVNIDYIREAHSRNVDGRD